MDTQALRAALAPLLVKDGVSLGGLADPARALALGWVWAGLPRAVMDERAVNVALKAQLAGAACCLSTDHVELRRWLCDAGWLERDGFGRAYRRQPPQALPERHRELGAVLESAFDGQDTAAFARECREQRAAEREARRRAHEAEAGRADAAVRA
jgi:hypothetical protein